MNKYYFVILSLFSVIAFCQESQFTVEEKCKQAISLELNEQMMDNTILNAKTPAELLKQERKIGEMTGSFKTAQNAVAKFCEYVGNFNH